ncbi:MAG TPA: sulfotransferase [Steroidobacteraceae bacterium]|jgi:tetratricopeptide (TPR) repeat protein
MDPTIAAVLEALAAGDARRAESLSRARLALDPNSVEHLRLLGRALTLQSRFDEAEQILRRALALRCEAAPLHEDLGEIQALQRRFEAAVASFETALRLDPRLPLARKKLGQALGALGRGDEADAALEAWFEQDPGRLQVAVALDHLAAGRKEEAIATLRKALRENPDNVDALHALAQAYWGDDERVSDIEALLRRATELAPALVSAWTLLGMLLHKEDRHEEAIGCYQRAIDIAPDNASAWSGLGANYALIGNMEQAAAAYERSVALQPEAAAMHMSYAHALKALGRQPEALAEYRAAIARKPDFGEVYWSMANLKVFRFEPAEVAAMEQQVEREDLSTSADVHFRFALGKACEDAGDYDRAWEFYHSGNQRQRPLVSYDPVAFEVRHQKMAEVFTREFLEQHAGQGFESDAPIFIVGLPRSGSTLIEQILASHSQVEGTLELPTLGDIAVSTARYRHDRLEYPESVRDLRDRDFRAYGKEYIEQTRTFRTTDKPRFTDKLPNNFSHVGFAQLILPNAKIINARRHPLDSILGSYKQLFGQGQNFTYDMDELVLYYRQYHEIMKHWHRVLPGKVLDVHYEETVGDLESQVRRILAHCGLPFEEACLRFHETNRAVRTASSEQVRQPLYTRALGTWRRYERHLRPWQEEIADIIAELPASVRNAGR